MKLSRRALFAGSAAAILGGQALATHQIVGNYRNFENPARLPLSSTSSELGEWLMDRELEVDPAALEMLAPDDYISRVYRDGRNGVPVDLFITYYKSQMRDKNAHSPKVCLPGSGWVPLTSRTETLRLPDDGERRVNYYVVGKGAAKNLVLYWYQTHRQVVADEYVLKLHRVWNSIRENRTDMIFVRTISPIDGTDEKSALDRLTRFIAKLNPTLRTQFS